LKISRLLRTTGRGLVLYFPDPSGLSLMHVFSFHTVFYLLYCLFHLRDIILLFDLPSLLLFIFVSVKLARMKESNPLQECRNPTHCEYAGISLRALQESHCEYAGIKRTASLQEPYALRVCRNHTASMQEWSTKVALGVKTKRLITSILGPACDLEESRYGHSYT
jgi:hypothetical protein